MADTIKLHLMENRSIRAEFNGRPYAYEGGINIVAGEQNATQFEIASIPARLIGSEISLQMVNSLKEEVDPPEIKNNVFMLPNGMAVAGYGQFVITLIKGSEKVVFLPFKVKVANTRTDWQNSIIRSVPIEIGQVVGLPAGSQPTVHNSGTELNPVLDFGIPKGDKGDMPDLDGTYPDMTVGTALNDGTGNNIANQFSELNKAVSDEQATRENAVSELQTALNAEIENRTSEDNAVQGDIDDINEKIPSTASPENQLADKAFVNSSINAMAAFYITRNDQGSAFPTHESLVSATTFYSGGKVRVPTQNDYATVLADETQPKDANGIYPTSRYVYQTASAGGTYPDGQWELSFVVNNTAFTQAQVDSINSGITAEKIAQMESATSSAQSTAENAQNTANGKYTKPSGGIPESDLSEAVQTKLNKEGGGVSSVNGQVGAVSITPANIGAVNKTGDTMTGALSCKFNNDFIVHDNEFNFGNPKGTLYYQYRNATVTEHRFCNGDGGGALANLSAGAIYDNGERVYSPNNRPGSISGEYTGNGGQQPPSYVGTNTLKCNMMDGFTGLSMPTGYSGYMDVLLMNAYTWSDVPYATALGIQKVNGSPRAYVAAGQNGDTWGGVAELYSTAHKPSASDVDALPTSGGTMIGLLSITTNSQTTTYGSQNAGFSHIETTAPKFYFNKSIAVDGELINYGYGYTVVGADAAVYDRGERVYSPNNPPFPVGYIYISTDSTSPANLFGGTWSKINSGYYLKSVTSGAGNYGNAGLPNITGSSSRFDSNSGWSGLATSDAFYTSSAGKTGKVTSDSSGSSYSWESFNFDASRSNSIYGNSTTVTPLNYSVYMWRRTA